MMKDRKSKMKHLKTFKISMLLLLATILTLVPAYSLGLSPGRKVLDFEPGASREVKLTIYNTEHKSFRATAHAAGELAEYIEFTSPVIDFNEKDLEKELTYKINMPLSFERAGAHSAEITITDSGGSNPSGQTTVSSQISLISELQVRVPYPGKYAEGSFDIAVHSGGKGINFFVRLSNLGAEGINSAKAIINIYDNDGNIVHSIVTDEKAIKPRERKELLAQLNGNLPFGHYSASASIVYDEKLQKIEKRFTVGEFFIDLIGLPPKQLKLGDIAKLSVLVENKANYPIRDFSAQIALVDGDGNNAADLKSDSVFIQPISEKEVFVFWDTKNMAEGIYDGRIILSYEERSYEKKITAKVSSDMVEFEIEGDEQPITIKISEGKASKIAVTAAIIIIASIMFYFFSARKSAVPRKRRRQNR